MNLCHFSLNMERTMPRNVYDLSASEQSQAGKYLCHLYYHSSILNLIDRDQRSGCPHNGGEHTLRLKVERKDLDAFLDLILEDFAQPGISPTLSK